MMGFSPFYNSSLKTYVSYFGSLFNKISIERYDSQGNITQVIPIALEYAPVSKTIVRATEFEDLGKRDVAITLPRMSFEIITIGYDSSRKLQTTNVNLNRGSAGSYSQPNPVPYNINFLLSIYTKNAEDASKIVEQIMPFFTPEFTSTLNLIPEMNYKVNVPVILNNITLRDTFEGTATNTRYYIWSLSFTMKAYFYGPITSSNGIIKQVITNFYANSVGLETLTITNTARTFATGEVIYQKTGSSNTALATINVSNSSQLTITMYSGQFVANSVVYGAASNASATIIAVNNIASPDEVVTIQPGLTANGSPTVLSSNSIPWQDINATDDYGFCIDIT